MTIRTAGSAFTEAVALAVEQLEQKVAALEDRVGVLEAPPLPPPLPPSTFEVGFSVGADFVWRSATDQGREMDEMLFAGAKWIRFDFDLWQWRSGLHTHDEFQRSYDLAHAKGLKILGVLWDYNNGQMGAGGILLSETQYANECKAMAQAFPNVDAWELGNEVNLPGFAKTTPDAAKYARMANAAAAAIRSVDADAKIVTAGLSPAAAPNRPHDFFQAMLTGGLDLS